MGKDIKESNRGRLLYFDHLKCVHVTGSHKKQENNEEKL